jgi:mannitol 2-dehydrogenase
VPRSGESARYIFAPDDPQAAVERLADPAIRIVSLTVTEGGYNVHPVPNSMVDRITPVTTDADRADRAREDGIEDAWPVVCEDFVQWVLEDRFAAGRPPFEDAGVQLVDDVVPYELMKLRLLNASHQGLCYFGHLAGYRAVHDVVRNPLFSEFLLRYMDQEATPTLAPLPGVYLEAYKHTLIDRFSNEHAADTVARLCAERCDRIPKWLMPVVRENLAADRPVDLSATIVASWARYAEGTDENGQPINVVDRLSGQLTAVAKRNREDPDAFIANRELFGDVIDDERFRNAYRAALASLHEKGLRGHIAATDRRTVAQLGAVRAHRTVQPVVDVLASAQHG